MRTWNKKGDVGDFFVVLVLFLVFAITLFAAVRTIGPIFQNEAISSQLNATGTASGTAGNATKATAEVMFGNDARGGRLFDAMIFGFYVFMNIALVITAVLLRNEAAFVVITLIFIIGVIVTAVFIQNTLESVYEGFNVNLPLTQILINNLVFIQFGFGVLTFVILFIANRDSGV